MNLLGGGTITLGHLCGINKLKRPTDFSHFIDGILVYGSGYDTKQTALKIPFVTLKQREHAIQEINEIREVCLTIEGKVRNDIAPSQLTTLVLELVDCTKGGLLKIKEALMKIN